MKLKVVVVDLGTAPRATKWGLRFGLIASILLVGGAVAYAAGLFTWADGQTLKAADLNGNFAYLQSEITALQNAARPPSAFHALLVSTTAVPSGQSEPIVFDTLEFDLGGEYSTTTGAFTPKHDGVYAVNCGLEALWTSPVTGEFSLQVFRNGSEVLASDVANYESTQTASRPIVSGILQLVAGDLVTCSAFQTTGASQSLFAGPSGRNAFSAARLY
jgi:hypothetical protein